MKTINELNESYTLLFCGIHRAWEDDKTIRYIWGNVLAENGMLKYYINDSKEIIGEITYYNKTIAGFQGRLWYVNNCLVGFTRDIDNKYVVPQSLGIDDCDMGYYIKGISESLKILEAEKRQSEEAKSETLNAILGIS